MPVNGFTVGRDLSFTLTTPSGNLAINGVTDYKSKPVFSNITHKGLDGIRINGAIPDGWEVTITLDRRDPTIDKYFAGQEAAYFAGVNVAGGTIAETVTEADGSVSQFQYTQVSLTYEDAGSYKSDSNIPLTLMARASRKLQLS